MKTFLVVNLGLAPLIVFGLLLGFASPGAAVAVGLAASIALGAWRFGRREFFILEVGGLGDLPRHGRPRPRGAGLLRRRGAVAVLRRPRPHRARQRRHSAALDVRLFARRLRRRIGKPAVRTRQHADFGPLGVLFLADALVLALHAGALATTALFAFGAAVSIFGPKLFVRAILQREIDTAERYRWPAPAIRRAPRAKARSTSRWSAPGSAASTAAALLADAGLKVAVFEAHVVPGGYCHTFLRKARHQGQACLYRFDAGPHDFSGLSPGGALASTLAAARRRRPPRLAAHRPLAIASPAATIDVPHDWRDYVALLGRLFPGDAAGFEALFADIQRDLRGHAGDRPRPRRHSRTAARRRRDAGVRARASAGRALDGPAVRRTRRPPHRRSRGARA